MAVPALVRDLYIGAPTTLQGVAYQPHRREDSLAELAAFMNGNFHPTGTTKKNPRQFPAGGSPSVSSLSGSEVTLSANVQEHGALVLELVDSGRLRSRRSQGGRTGELLVEEERADFSRERQVLDGSPAGDHTNLGNVEVGVAAIVCRHGLAEVEARAELTLGGKDVEGVTAVAHRGVAAPEAGRPVGIPVVVERTTDTPCIHQLDVAGSTAGKKPGQENRISRLAKANALVRTQTARATEHREVRRSTARGDHGLGVTLRVRCVDLEIVARTGRDVLDLQRNVHRTAPLVFGVTGDFRQSGRNAASADDVVGSVHEVPDSANLEQTPSLIDADVAGDIRSMSSAVSVGTSGRGL